MQLHNETPYISIEIEELFPSQAAPLISKKAADKLQSHMITGFEAALDQGMRPLDALALILCWVSSEMVRIRLEGASSPVA
ncbi:MAG: hypothetical protein HY765_01645 [Rhodomicrobium sp.]|nr:hypothetical protein [Rhodomicrobium sp.]